MFFHYFLLLALCCSPSYLFPTALGDLAASMKAGEWKILTPKPGNLPSIGGAGNINAYGESAAWDPTTQRFFFIGSNHYAPYRFAVYSVASNSWSNGPALPNIPYSTLLIGHGYDHNTVDPATGNFFYHVTNTMDIYKYATATNTWSKLPKNPLKTQVTEVDALTYFPELGGLIWLDANMDLFLFRETTQQWSRLALNALTTGSLKIAEYNPVHKIAVIGGGNGQFRKISSTGQITTLPNVPISIYDGSGFMGHITTDPVSGNYLATSADGSQLYQFDVAANQWNTAGSPPPAGLRGVGSVAAAVGTYGVNVFMSCGPYSFVDCYGDIYVYKHSAGAGIETRVFKENEILKISPNPFKGGRLIIRTGLNLGQIGIFDLGGREVMRWNTQPSLTWDGKNGRGEKLAPGIYLIRLMDKHRTYFSKKIAVAF